MIFENSLNNLILRRQLNLIDNNLFKYNFLEHVYESKEYSPLHIINFDSTLNHLALDFTNKFLLVSDANGNVYVQEVINEKFGFLNNVARKEFFTIMIHRSQWFPNDNGMFAVTQTNIVSLVDTNSFQICDSYKFDTKSTIYWSDWNPIDVNLISVALSNSCLRFIDIRTGSSVQEITTKSPIRSKNHFISRIIWAPLDNDCFFAGDSSGYIHLYDIRKPKNPVQVVGEDYTSCESICCMEFTPNKTSLIVSQGKNTKNSMWIFKNKKLRNSNVNYDSKNNFKNSSDKSSFFRYQIYCTDDFLFTPLLNNHKEMIVYDLHSGKCLNTFKCSNWLPNSICNSACVIGLYNDHNVFYSGSKKRLTIWNCKIETDETKEKIEKLHQDNWSDSE